MNIRPDRVLQNVVLVQFFPYPPEGDSFHNAPLGIICKVFFIQIVLCF